MMKMLPAFHEHEEDARIPAGFGIDESHDGGFYPYAVEDEETCPGCVGYLQDATGNDLRCKTYDAARRALRDELLRRFGEEIGGRHV